MSRSPRSHKVCFHPPTLKVRQPEVNYSGLDVEMVNWTATRFGAALSLSVLLYRLSSVEGMYMAIRCIGAHDQEHFVCAGLACLNHNQLGLSENVAVYKVHF